ncbi:hypothetical protein BD410DRAFT_788532 [Rickenella mellea]|uniref:Ribosomal protein/NADH dehydrogenase domain-containing protein n=1 Tax=Rickenella mellea TaxID=50990 RepID=A0A4Y7Q3R3_9AGAM|nr:hypothetical protein BD410DRAFT_788532 [Rickenella mellea]
MPRKVKVIPGPSKLSQVLEVLNKVPRPALAELQALRLKMAARNDHFGARHFVRDDLPRIRYANPTLKIEVNKVKKLKEDKQWKPEIELEFRDGRKETMDLSNKLSSDIFNQLMASAGGATWNQSKLAATVPLNRADHR